MIVLEQPPQLILPDHYQANRPAIIRPSVDLARYFPVEIDRKTRRAIVKELTKRGFLDDRAKIVNFLDKADDPERAAIPFGMFVGKAITVTYITAVDTDTDGSSFSFGSISIGTAAADRRVLVLASGINNGSGTISTLTIAGVSATKVSGAEGTNGVVSSSFWILNVPTGTTATIAGTCSSTKSRYGIGVWAMFGLSSDTAVGSGGTGSSGTNTPLSLTPNSRPNGWVICGGGDAGAGVNSFTGATLRFDEVVGAASNHGGADGPTTGTTHNVTMTFGTTTQHAFAAVTF